MAQDEYIKILRNETKKAKKRQGIKREISVFSGLFIASFVILFVVVTWPVLDKHINFAAEYDHTADADGVNTVCPEAGTVSETAYICVPKLKLEAPVIIGGGTEFYDVFEDLKRGVVLSPDGAYPGELGNVFVTGHSNDYPWRQGDYKTIFALLGKLEHGDAMYLYYDEQRFKYTVYESFQVYPAETWVMDNNPDESIVSLMTCWPPTTTWKRLIVRGRLQKE
ncbi:sortase [Patescibacteria group bacterium]